MHGRELEALVGRWARLRPTDGEPVVRDARAAGPAKGRDRAPAGWVEVAVVSNLDDVVRCETRDPRALALAGRPVLVELGAEQAMIRVPGQVRLMIDHPLPVVLAVTATGPLEHLQRRQWVRARVTVPVAIAVDACRKGSTLRTATVDLSGGGARLRPPAVGEVGSPVSLTLWLPSGPVEIDGSVLDADEDGLRVAFERVPEAIVKRIVRFVFDVQIHRQHTTSS